MESYLDLLDQLAAEYDHLKERAERAERHVALEGQRADLAEGRAEHVLDTLHRMTRDYERLLEAHEALKAEREASVKIAFVNYRDECISVFAALPGETLPFPETTAEFADVLDSLQRAGALVLERHVLIERVVDRVLPVSA